MVFYRNKNGRPKHLTSGRYPAVKLVDARELARESQRKVAHGGDPVDDIGVQEFFATRVASGRVCPRNREQYASTFSRAYAS
jgi:hypothetical protein